MKRWLILAAGLGLVLAIAIIAYQGFGAVAQAFAAVGFGVVSCGFASRRGACRRRARLVDHRSGIRAMSALRVRLGALHPRSDQRAVAGRTSRRRNRGRSRDDVLRDRRRGRRRDDPGRHPDAGRHAPSVYLRGHRRPRHRGGRPRADRFAGGGDGDLRLGACRILCRAALRRRQAVRPLVDGARGKTRLVLARQSGKPARQSGAHLCRPAAARRRHAGSPRRLVCRRVSKCSWRSA